MAHGLGDEDRRGGRLAPGTGRLGMSRRRLDEMILSLAPALALPCEQTLLARRGGRDSLNGAAGRAPKLTPAQRILAIVLYLRKLANLNLLGELFDVTPMTVSRTVREVRPLLQQHGYQIAASTARFRSPADITRYLGRETTNTDIEIKTACLSTSPLSHRLV